MRHIGANEKQRLGTVDWWQWQASELVILPLECSHRVKSVKGKRDIICLQLRLVVYDICAGLLPWRYIMGN